MISVNNLETKLVMMASETDVILSRPKMKESLSNSDNKELTRKNNVK